MTRGSTGYAIPFTSTGSSAGSPPLGRSTEGCVGKVTFTTRQGLRGGLLGRGTIPSLSVVTVNFHGFVCAMVAASFDCYSILVMMDVNCLNSGSFEICSLNFHFIRLFVVSHRVSCMASVNLHWINNLVWESIDAQAAKQVCQPSVRWRRCDLLTLCWIDSLEMRKMDCLRSNQTIRSLVGLLMFALVQPFIVYSRYKLRKANKLVIDIKEDD